MGALGSETIWHDVETGGYAADLALWAGLAREAAGDVLDLGAGTGRVALHLARAGIGVTALDRSRELLAELGRRAERDGLAVETILADARDFALDRRFAAVIAPMQLIHLLGGASGRAGLLRCVRAHLAPGGLFAAALLVEVASAPPNGPPPLPDVREIDGWVYSSQPLEVRDADGALELLRLRQVVSPAGDLEDEFETILVDRLDAEAFEAEAAAAGLSPRERLEVPPTADHVGSTVCVLEAHR
jgi:SAM-dependent methyltransferase